MMSTSISPRKNTHPVLVRYSIVESPLGRILIAGSGHGIRTVSFLDGTAPVHISSDWMLSPESFRNAEEQLTAYFRGALREFDVELDLEGTEFQIEVWNELRRVPYGRTSSYTEIAAAIGRPKAVRAVGAANGANPVPVFIPCHRILGSDGRLTGYRGGIDIKRRLIELEQRAAERSRVR